MTDHFEVHARDGAARIGEVRLAAPLRTPGLVGDRLRDAGSEWAGARDTPSGDAGEAADVLTVLPHRALPPGTPAQVRETFGGAGNAATGDAAAPEDGVAAGSEAPDAAALEFPTAAVVNPDTAADHGADAYVLSGGPALVDHAERFVDAVMAVRRAIPDDAALYLAGAATPANVAALVYAGVDLVDADGAYVRGTEGFYLTTDGEYFLEDLEELPCACPACSEGREAFDRAACAEHNVNALETALATVRTRIREGRLRDYLEGQGRHESFPTAVLRRLDQEYAYVEERAPLFRRESMLAATDDSLRRPEIQRFADRVTSRYVPRFDDLPLLLVPCSATKPYSESQSHAQFHRAIDYRAHTVSMTSPIGVVPQELETTYPAQHYDSVVTGRWTETEYEFVAEVLRRYLERADYPRVVAHLPDDYRPIVERALERLEDAPPVAFTVADHPTTDDSLAELADALEGEDRFSKREREHHTVRALADYVFGDSAGDRFFRELRTGSRYPKLRAMDAGLEARPGDNTDDDGAVHVATMVPNYGTLSLTLAGARRWVDSDVSTKRVEIDAFVPQGSVLAPGVVDADESIRVGDEVVVEGPQAFAVGRAQAHGRAMVESTRGVVVQVRHSKEL
ncbi:MAG: archaeosine synthase subunit alpha [Haloglomus sp.]